MHIQKALKILSPLDVITFKIKDQAIVKKKDIQESNFASFLVPKALKFLNSGEHSERNPTIWKILDNKKREELEDLNEKLSSELASSPQFHVNLEELDNNNQVITVTSEVSMLALNCKFLEKDLLKETKCATAHTAFGKLDLETT